MVRMASIAFAALAAAFAAPGPLASKAQSKAPTNAPSGALGEEEQVLAEAKRRLVVPVAAPESPGKLRWRADWEEGSAEARRRNCPLLIVYSDDKSVGLDSVEAAVYTKSAFADLCRDCVLLIAYDGSDHKSTQRDVAGVKVAWCTRFEVACEEHRKLHKLVQERFVAREFWNPLHVFVDGDGNELGRAEGHDVDQARLDREYGKARRRLGAPLPAGEYAALMKKLKGIVDGREKGGAAAADAELGSLVAAQERVGNDWKSGPLKMKGMVDYVKQLRKRIAAEGDALLRVAQARVRRGDVAGARALLDQTAKSFKELPAGKSAKELLAQLKG